MLGLALLFLQACIFQMAYSQCLGARYPEPALNGIPGYGYGLEAPGLPAAPGLLGPGPPGLPGVPGVAEYGGAGVGDITVIGEMPVIGTTLVAGQVPILGAVRFSGEIPAGGVVTLSGTCSCGCNFPYIY